MTDQQVKLPFAQTSEWASLPSTKVRKPQPGSANAWTYAYTAFSLDFSKDALRFMGVGPTDVVLDPFCGSGTSLVAAAALGANTYGIDVNPFSALLSRVRLTEGFDKDRAMYYLAATPDTQGGMEQTSLLPPADIDYVRAVAERMRRSLNYTYIELWGRLLDEEALGTEAVTVLCLALAARMASSFERGSNPIWYKVATEPSSRGVKAFIAATAAWIEIIHRDKSSENYHANSSHVISNRDIRAATEDKKFDFCLTSPPYANRLDYVVSYRPELEVIRQFVELDIESLRRLMLGTTKITEKVDIYDDAWGRSCLNTLDSIRKHPSYASERYYFHTYRSYFSSLYQSLASIVQMMKPGASGLIVLQDSYYKDLNLPTQTICKEMLMSLTNDARIVRNEPVRFHMGRLSPSQNAHAPKKILSESLIHFTK